MGKIRRLSSWNHRQRWRDRHTDFTGSGRSSASKLQQLFLSKTTMARSLCTQHYPKGAWEKSLGIHLVFRMAPSPYRKNYSDGQRYQLWLLAWVLIGPEPVIGQGMLRTFLPCPYRPKDLLCSQNKGLQRHLFPNLGNCDCQFTQKGLCRWD